MRYLNLRYNQLSGSIPAALGNLADLGTLHLNNNLLSGSIPTEFGNLQDVSTLNLNNNLLTGEIPPSLANLSWVSEFNIGTNCLYALDQTLRTWLENHDPDWESTQNNCGTITLTSPNGGENWSVESLHDITWTTSGDVGDVKIEFSTDNGSNWSTIISSTANTGSYNWTVTNSISSQCMIKISDANIVSLADTSDGTFSISELTTITVTSPNGGENWLIGSTHDITWTSSGTVGSVKIEYSPDNGSNWNEINTNTENDGSYTWSLPNTSSPNYLVRVSETDGDPSDFSDGVFTLSEGISGTVTDGLGNGIVNVNIEVRLQNGGWMPGGLTGANGYYEIPGITPGNYKVLFDPRNAGNYVQQWFNNGSRFESADIVTVNTGQVSANINAQLADGGAVSGRVTDEAGNGIVNVDVQIMDLSIYTYTQVNTGADGYYTVQGVAPGNCRVYFNGTSAGNYIPEYYNNKNGWQPLSSDTVAVTAGQTTENIDAQLATGGSISGRVTDGAGNGIPGVNINVRELTGNGISGANTDGDGYYTATAIPTGSYMVYFDGAGAGNYVPEFYNNKNSWEPQTADTVSVTAGQTTPGIDVQLDEGATILGRVTDGAGNGINGVSVQIKRTDNYTIIWTGTDGAGNYTARGVPAGSWKVLFQSANYSNYVSEFYNDKMSLENADLINVTAGQTIPNVDAQLADGGSISGRVTDILGNGIPNVSISVFDTANNNWINRSGGIFTDENGYYTYTGVPAGNHKISFDTYNVLFYRIEYYNDKQDFQYADVVSVTPNQDTPNIDAQLAPAGTISGRVTDENGNGIANVWVTANDLNNNYAGGQFTDAQGNYLIPYGLFAGSYKVYFDTHNRNLNYIGEWYDNKNSFANADPVIVVNGQITANIDAQLATGGGIAGRVTDESGSGIADADVNIHDANGSSIDGARTGADGNYSFQGLPAGNWKVYFNAANVGNYLPRYYNNKDGWNPQLADSVSVTVGQTVTGINAQLTPGGIISGRVTDESGNGIPGVGISVRQLSQYGIAGATTDADGYYTVWAIPAGNCIVYFDGAGAGNYVPEYYNDKFKHHDADILTVTTGQTIGNIDAQLATGGIISGRVVDGSGNGIPNVSVQISDTENYTFIWVGTDGGGYYTAQGVPAGNWRVFFQPPQSANFVSEYYNDKLSANSADLVNVIAGQTTANIDAQLVEGGIITGRVTDESGNGIANIYISVCDASNNNWLPGRVATDSGGYYTFNGIPTGNHRVYFDSTGAGNYVPEYYNNKNFWEPQTADTVSVTAGQTTANINVQLATGGIITGRVTDESGNGIPGVGISVQLISQYGISGATTDAGGYYTAWAIPTGNYIVYFDGAGNYVPEYYNDKFRHQDANIVTVTIGQTIGNIDAQLAQGGTISGRVTDENGNGIADANVNIRDTNGSNITGTRTGADGNYSFPCLPAGNWKVYFNAANVGNYIPRYYNNKDGWNPQLADSVSLTAGQTVTGIDAQLLTGGIISGRVVDQAGNGIPNASVEIMDTVQYYTINWSSTDANGYYTARGLPAGTWKIRFNATDIGNYVPEFYNDKFKYQDAGTVTVAIGQTVGNIDAQLMEGGIITGRVTDGSGNGITGVSIEIRDATNYTFIWAGTDGSGYYTAQGVPAGNWRVFFRASQSSNFVSEYYNDKLIQTSADLVNVIAGQTTANIDAQLGTGGSISGRVTDMAGNGVANIYINVCYASNNNWLPGGTTTDGQGYYILNGIPTGNYKVQFDTYNALFLIQEYYNDKPTRETADNVSVTAGQTTTGINAQLASGGSISGRVTDENGNGIANASVQIRYGNGQTIIWSSTNVNGDYTAKGIASGNWLVYFSAVNVGNYIPQYYNNKDGWNPQLADSVIVTPGQTVTGINAQLSPGGIISGRVTDQAGNGIPYANVEVMESANYRTIQWLNTDADGYYTARGLPAGTWKIRFDATNVGNYVPEFYNDKFAHRDAGTVNVAIGQTIGNIDAQLAEGGIITGRVTDGSGNGIPNASVQIRDNTNYTFIWTDTDGSGYYTAQGVPAGSWRVFFQGPQASTFVSEFYNDKLWQNSADLVNVTAGQTTANINAQLAVGGSISGHVANESGNGIYNVNVQVRDANNNVLTGVNTDSSGNYTIYGISPGNYKIYFETNNAGNYVREYYNDKTSFAAADSVTVTAGQTTPNIDAQLTTGGAISGHVVDGNGNGIYNVNVQVRYANNNYLTGANTDSSGNYTIYGVSPGTYKIYFETNNAGNYVREYYNDKTSIAAADNVTVTAGQTTENIDAQLAAGATITGRVTDQGGNGIQSVRVRVYDANNLQVMNTLTNSSGDYTLMRILPGNYRVRFDTSAMNANYIGEYYNDKVTLGSADVQALVAGQTITANAVLAPGGIISGRITDTNGNGVANVRIAIRTAFSNVVYVNNKYTDGSGNYIVQGLPAGSYKVFFNTDETQNSYIPEWYNDKADFLTAGILNVIPGQTLSGIDAVLASGGTITGHITDASTGDPIPDIEIYALDLNKNVTGCYSYTDGNGDYALKGLPTGTFKINFNSYSYNEYYGGNYNDQWHNNKTTFQSADGVAVTAGQTVSNINAALTADGGVIRGRVTNENGDGVPNVDVWVTAEWSEFSGWEAYTDANGYYQVTGIPTGSYHVLFLTNTAQGNYLDEAYNDKALTGSPTIEADWVNVVEGQAVENINAVLSVGGYVSGRVTDQNGNPLRDIRVRLYDAASGDYFSRHSALTDFYGNYTLLRVRPGQLKAYFQSYESAGGNYKAKFYNDKTTLAAGDAFTVTATQTTSGIDAVLAAGGGALCGYVRDKNGAVLKNAAVQLFDKNASRCLLGQVSCNVNGYFEFKSVIPDQYKLYISCNNYITPEWYNNKASHAQADLVTVNEGKTTLVEITLGEDSSLTILSPNGGEIWNVGSSHALTWINNGPVGNVRLEYSIDNGASWIEIVSSTENIGIYNWVVPNTPSVNCLVRISEAGDGSPADVSGAVFTIFANPANWIPVEGLQNNMIVYGKAYNNMNEAVAGDWIGAFGPGGINDCRGTSIIGANGSFYFTICSNAVSGETITFKLWPYPTGPALDADETIEFISDSVYGGLPLHFGARTQLFSLVGGWNWTGFNTLPTNTSLNAIFGSLAGKISQVKTQTQAAVYTGGTWIGDLANMNGIANGAMYKIETTQPCILSLSGATVPYNTPLPMVTGWNWVSYLPVLSQNVDVALNTIMPILLQAKSQTQSTVKVGGGLIGDLTKMEPNKGYTIQVSAPGLLLYPHGESAYPDQSDDAAAQSNISETTSLPWTTIQGNQYNMVSYGKVFFEGLAVTTPGYYLVSVGPKGEGDCRSISSIGTDGSYFSTILGSANGEAIKFKLYNSTAKKTYDVVETFAFQSDTLKGDYNFKARSVRITAPTGGQQFNMGSICSITWDAYNVTNVKIELYKNGKSLTTIVSSVPANTHSYSWTIPTRMRSGNNYQIRISAIDVGVMADDTTANFTILPTAALVLNYPVGTEVWQVKRSYDITWGSSGIDNIKIELYKGAALNTVISESTPAAAGKYTWTVPANQTLGSDYIIRISSVDAGVNLSDISKSAFTIAAYKNTTADFDGDGKADLAWRYYGAGGYNCIWLSGIMPGSDAVNDARLAPQAVNIQDETNLDNKLSGTGDFNNDGKEDLLWRDKVTGDNFVWYMNGAAFAGTAPLPAETTLSWDICGTGDFNSDGKPDIVWRNQTNGSNKVWLMNGIALSGEVTLTTEADLNWDIVGAGDFNGDGKPDVLWRNSSDGANRIWIMNGTTLVRTEQLSAVNTVWEIAGVGDYDGNGKPDIFWRHKVDGRDSVWIMDDLARAESLNITRVSDNDWKIEN
jgi:protocatechuate 3,4-dioxygenase beta subunit